MEQLIDFSASGRILSYSSSYPTVPSTIAGRVGSSKLAVGNSPNSLLSTHFESDSFTRLSDSLEQHSSAEYLSRASASSNSPFENNYWFQRLSHSLDGPNMEYPLQELEMFLMGPNSTEDKKPWIKGPLEGSVIQSQPSIASSYKESGQGHHIDKRLKTVDKPLEGFPPPYNLKQLLIECARSLSQHRIDDFDKLVEQARHAVSIRGEPIQRLGAYMVEGLVARKEASGNSIYRALRCREPESKDLLSYMHLLYEICPYLKFGYMAANGAIAEVCRNEDRIHIIDFQISQGTQWLTLLQALAARPGGPPHVRITGIDDPVSKYARDDGLEVVGRRLAAISKKFNISVEFLPVSVFGSDVTREMLDVRPGEALAVNFPLQLHHTPDESVDVNNPRDGLLRMVKSLSPKVTTLVEQESNTNTTPFLTRFVETLDFYSAMFDSIDVGVELQRDSRDRINVEQHCLAKDIVNIIACEGKERVERHELFGKWKSRLTMAGFHQYPLSSYVNSVIRSLLRRYSDHYTLEEKDGAMLLGWKNRNLISASAWF